MTVTHVVLSDLSQDSSGQRCMVCLAGAGAAEDHPVRYISYQPVRTERDHRTSKGYRREERAKMHINLNSDDEYLEADAVMNQLKQYVI